MIRDRYLVSIVSNGRFLDERLFTSKSAARQYAVGASSVLVGLRMGFAQVVLKDRRKGRFVDYMQIEGIGKSRASKRLSVAVLGKRRKAK